MNGLLYLFAAFAVIWIVLFLYMFGLSRQQRALRREIEMIRDHLTGKEQGRI